MDRVPYHGPFRRRLRRPSREMSHQRWSSFHHLYRLFRGRSGLVGSLSASEVQDELCVDEKNWGNGELDREGTGVGTVDEHAESLPESCDGWRRNSEEPLKDAPCWAREVDAEEA